MRYRYTLADVFTTRIFGGNQLAVFPHAEGLNDTQMQQIARELNLSETVFVFPPKNPKNTRRVRIFTPGMELPFAGHPTVGTAMVLAALKEIKLKGDETAIILEEEVGPVLVTICAEDGKPTFAQLTAAKLPEFGPEAPAPAELAAMLSLQETDIAHGEFAPGVVSCGVPFVYIPLQSHEAVAKASLRRDQWERLLAHFAAPHVYVMHIEPVEHDEAALHESPIYDKKILGGRVHARMFAPAMGITEDPATGAAAASLGGYLASRHCLTDGTLTWTIDQGAEMGRPSRIEIEVDKHSDHITAVRVGGAAVIVGSGELEV